jgi:hypothetical protein
MRKDTVYSVSSFRRSLDTPSRSTTCISTSDKSALAIATCRAMFFPGINGQKVFDDEIMARAIEQIASDCPMFAGRVEKLRGLSWRVADVTIVNSNIGIEFKVANQAGKIADMSDPSTWTMQNINISNPEFPSYLPFLDSGMKLLQGKEPLCKIQLTHLRDGDILSISMSHMMTDGMHWPMFVTHLAARYKEIASGIKADGSKLMAWDGNKTEMTYGAMKKFYIENGMISSDWEPKPIQVKASLMDHLRGWMLLFKNGTQKVNFNIIGVSNERLKQLKASVMETIKAEKYAEGTYVSTGDVVQALGMIMVCGGQKKTMTPQKPNANLVLTQIPCVHEKFVGDKKYFGNSVHLIQVSFDKNELPLEALSSPLSVLTRLAVRLRERTLEFRNDPTMALQALFESETVFKSSAMKSLGYLAGNRFPYVNCTTNYIGPLKEDSELEFTGTGALVPSAVQWLVTPLARDMNVIRPYRDGLLFHLALTPKDSKRLRTLPHLEALVPDCTIY